MQNIALGRLRRNLHLQPRSCVLLQPCCSIDVCYVFRWCTKPFLKQEREEKDKKQSSTRSSREATRTHKGGKGEMKKKRRKNVKPNRVNEKIMQASVARPLSSLSLFPALAFAISSTPIFFFFPDTSTDLWLSPSLFWRRRSELDRPLCRGIAAVCAIKRRFSPGVCPYLPEHNYALYTLIADHTSQPARPFPYPFLGNPLCMPPLLPPLHRDRVTPYFTG